MAKYGTKYRVAPKPKKKRPLLPVLGLSLAILLGLVSYLAAPALLQFGEDQSEDLKSQMDDFRNDPDFDALPDETPEYILMAMMWLIMMGLAMFLVSAAIGTDPEKMTQHMMGPSPANKEAVVKQLKRDLKVAKKRARQRKR
jgi:hypothetical protein